MERFNQFLYVLSLICVLVLAALVLIITWSDINRELAGKLAMTAASITLLPAS